MLALTISDEKKEQIIRVSSTMSEKQKRQYLAREALLLGYSGISLINRITGVSINTIRHGIEELKQGDIYECGAPERIEGAGRPKFTDTNANTLEAIEEIVSGATYGTPAKVLVWTTLSLRKISAILENDYSIKISHTTVGKALELLGYSRQCNKKMQQIGNEAPDGNEQLEYINAKAQEFIDAGEPVISVESHLSSGTSKWNKIEHKMFCYISKNWQGQPLVDIETVINLISSTTTEKGLKIMCIPDYNKYELGKTVSDEEFFALPIEYLNELGNRNYVIKAVTN